MRICKRNCSSFIELANGLSVTARRFNKSIETISVSMRKFYTTKKSSEMKQDVKSEGTFFLSFFISFQCFRPNLSVDIPLLCTRLKINHTINYVLPMRAEARKYSWGRQQKALPWILKKIFLYRISFRTFFFCCQHTFNWIPDCLWNFYSWALNTWGIHKRGLKPINTSHVGLILDLFFKSLNYEKWS